MDSLPSLSHLSFRGSPTSHPRAVRFSDATAFPSTTLSSNQTGDIVDSPKKLLEKPLKPLIEADPTKPLPPGMTIVQTGGDGEEKMVRESDLQIDPIARKEFKIQSPFTDNLLQPTWKQQLTMPLRHLFVTLPKTIGQGLRGDNSFTFSDFLDVAKIPYYAGGTCLAMLFAAGGDRFTATKQGLGVGLYYLGVMAANTGINKFYQWKTGVDLGLQYQKANGDIENVLASVDFPRTDLLTEKQKAKIARKTGVPSNVADPEREINDKIRHIISAARADQLLVGNLLAAVGAGYIARSNLWGRLLDSNAALRAIWRNNDRQPTGLFNRLGKTVDFAWGKVKDGLRETFHGPPHEKNPWFRRSVLGLVVGGIGTILWHSWKAANPEPRQYFSPAGNNLSPQLSPLLSPQTAAIQKGLPGGEIQNPPHPDLVKLHTGGPA